MLPQWIDELRYGAPSKQDFENLKHPGYLDRLLDKLYALAPPANSSEQTKNELIFLLRQSNVRQITRKELFDRSLIPFLDDLFIKNGADAEDVTTTTQNICNDVLPIITKLKYHFNRPRPYQILYYYPEIELYPDYSYFVSSPSYPSGHAIIGLVTGHVLANHYPQSYAAMQNFMQEIQLSRLALGVHYPSDNDFAKIVVQEIISDAEFLRKYDL
jgi:acid phosphatase (class A)